MLKSAVIVVFITNFSLSVHGDPISVGISNEYFRFHDYPERPECKDGTATLCQEVDQYPIDRLIPTLKNQKKIEIPNQYGKKDYDDNICPTDIQDVMPRAGYNANDVLMYIVNVENVYTQVVRKEICRGENSTCDNVVSVDGYKSYCQQSYTYQSLLTFDSSFHITTDYFKIPSGCCCMTKRS